MKTEDCRKEKLCKIVIPEKLEMSAPHGKPDRLQSCLKMR